MCSTLDIHSRIASLVASLRVLLPDVTPYTSVPIAFMRKTFNSWRRTSSTPMYTLHDRPNSAAAVADATPCWPAPVSAIIRFLPIRRVSSAWPMALLILCAPVWFKSSRFK